MMRDLAEIPARLRAAKLPSDFEFHIWLEASYERANVPKEDRHHTPILYDAMRRAFCGGWASMGMIAFENFPAPPSDAEADLAKVAVHT